MLIMKKTKRFATISNVLSLVFGILSIVSIRVIYNSETGDSLRNFMFIVFYNSIVCAIIFRFLAKCLHTISEEVQEMIFNSMDTIKNTKKTS